MPHVTNQGVRGREGSYWQMRTMQTKGPPHKIAAAPPNKSNYLGSSLCERHILPSVVTPPYHFSLSLKQNMHQQKSQLSCNQLQAILVSN